MRVGIYSGLVLAVGLTAFYLYKTGPGVQLPEGPVQFVVVSDPPDCDVYLDEKPLGKTAGGSFTLDLDPRITDVRWMELRKPGFAPVRRALSAYSGLPGMELKLRRRAFDAFITSIPTDADVWINGELRGFTPLATKLLPEGDKPIRVEVRRPGYKTAEYELKPPDDAEVARADLTLAALPPQLRITSDPPGATAMLDGRSLGPTPVSIALDESTRGKQVKVAASLEKHDPAELTLEVPKLPSGDLVANLKLTAQGTALNIVTEPPGAIVRVNRTERGASPVTVRLADDDLAAPLTLEALIPGSHFGKLELNDVGRGGTTLVRIPLDLYGRRVVFAVDCAAPAVQDFELRRSRVKDQIHALAADQEFAVVALFGGRTFIGPEPTPTRCTSEQKIRAYDRMDGLRYSGAESDSLPLLLAALSQQPDSVWLFTSAPIERSTWLMALDGEGVPRPSIQLVTSSAKNVEPWLRDWLIANRGAVLNLGEQTAAAP